MCGIAAVISRVAGNGAGLADVGAMLDALRHRGARRPASRAYGTAVLGCVRLDIVDSAGGAQPMETDTHAIAFNGEIYNHLALRHELEAQGARFRTRCDTEVLLQGYAAWGEGLLDRLEGMYAFVVVERETGRFLAARDPYGIKPLYVVETADAWWFSSEIRPLLGHGGEPRNVPAGGHVTEDGVSARVRYEAIDPTSPYDVSIDEAIAAFRAEFSRSVESHLPPDELRTAVFCSGGVDSSAILYEAVQACRRRAWDPRDKLVAYSVGTASSEDPKIARRLADEFGVPFVFEEITVPDMLAQIPRAVAVMESFEPNHIRAGTTSLSLSRRVADDGFKVALLGEGADELLGGYQEFAEAARTGGTSEVEALIRTFSGQLHRTQLRRVDRTSMSATLEARVPFLGRRFTRLINKIPTDYKVHRTGGGEIVGKYVLREAYRGLMPDYIVDRRKVPMGEGAGVGDNRPVGPFHEHSEAMVSDEDFRRIARDNPGFSIRTKEEALYFSYFAETFGPLAMAAERPRTNALQTR